MSGRDNCGGVIVCAIVQDSASRVLLQRAVNGTWELPGRPLIPEAGVSATLQIHLNETFAIRRVSVFGQHLITLGPSPEEAGRLMVLADCGLILESDIDHAYLATKPDPARAAWVPAHEAPLLLERRQSAALEYSLRVRPSGGYLHMPWEPDIDALGPDVAGYPPGRASRASTPRRGIPPRWPDSDPDKHPHKALPAGNFAPNGPIAEVTVLDTRRPRP